MFVRRCVCVRASWVKVGATVGEAFNKKVNKWIKVRWPNFVKQRITLAHLHTH